MKLEELFRELSRRRVFRVAASYAVVAWLVIQVAEVAFEAFDVPSWSLRLVILLALLGFPVALALAWAFDLTSRGLERTRAPAGAGEGGDPDTGNASSPRTSRPRAVFAALVVIAGVAAATLTVVRVSDGPGVAGDPRESVMVLPFENLTGSAELEYLEDASTNLLGLALSHWDEMRVYDDERTGTLLRRRGIEDADEVDLDVAVELAGEAGVGTFVLGEVRPEGDSLAVDAKVYDTESGDRIAQEIARMARGADPRPPFEALASAILQVSGAPPGERPDLLAQTTRSLEAYRAYLAGTRALQLFRVDSAIAAFERAVEIDSTFALAYLRLRDADGWAGLERDPRRRREWIAKAAAHSEGLPPRYMSLVGYHEAYSGGRYGRAREIARGMIERDSTDVEAWYQLGEAHFHHQPGTFPHADTLGDFVSALTAFRRTLALDSGYVLAYQHIIDVLGGCAADEAPWLCLDDRTVYGMPSELDGEFGADTVSGIRSRAAEARFDAAYAWVSAAPGSDRARNELLGLLVDADRRDEAARQIEVLRAGGGSALADVWESRIAFRSDDYGTAATILADLLAGTGPLPEQLVDNPDRAFGTLLAGGRPLLAFETMEDLLALTPVDTVSGPGGTEYAKPRFERFWQLQMRVFAGQETELLPEAVLSWLDVLDTDYRPGTPAHRRRWLEAGSTVLGAYLATGDTLLLSRFTAAGDSAPSRSRRTVDAYLALERGDTASARRAVAMHFEDRDALEIAGDAGAMRLFAWARLLERLGRPADAAAAFGLFDTEASMGVAYSLHVRSWYERGRLHEALGQPALAAGSYRRFIDAWEDGDATVQSLVERARAALAGLEEVGGAS